VNQQAPLPDHARRLDALRKLMRFLDEAFRVPGTNLRFGWDPIIGLVPWAGDLLTAILGCAIVVQGHKMRIPGVVQLRMLLNIGIDLLIGVVPVVGDAADVFWKSNAKNFALLERHAPRVQPPTRGDWLFVVGIIGAVAAMALVPLIVLYWLAHMLMGHVPPV
jgi:hypothetical protein